VASLNSESVTPVPLPSSALAGAVLIGGLAAARRWWAGRG
jgi:hypothetical protein